MAYRMIFSDMDGTLLKNDMEISEKTSQPSKKPHKKVWNLSSVQAEVFMVWNVF